MVKPLCQAGTQTTHQQESEDDVTDSQCFNHVMAIFSKESVNEVCSAPPPSLVMPLGKMDILDNRVAATGIVHYMYLLGGQMIAIKNQQFTRLETND